MTKKIVFTLCVIALFIFIWFAVKPKEKAPEESQPLPVPKTIQRDTHSTPPSIAPPEDTQTPTPTVKKIDLNRSDSVVKTFINDNAQGLADWLATNEYIRRFVMTVNALSQGNTINEHPLIIKKIAPFNVVKDPQTGTMTADSNNGKRLYPLIKIATAMPPKTLATFYHQYQYLFEKAYQELGTTGNFDQQLQRLLDNIIACPPLMPNATLTQDSVTFQYQRPTLEKASPLNKMLWRLGNDSLKTIQNYAQALKTALYQ